MLSDLHPPFNRRPPKDAPLRSRKPVVVGPLLPSDRQAELAAHEEASALIAMGRAFDTKTERCGDGKFIVWHVDKTGAFTGRSIVRAFSDEEGGR